MRRFLIFLIAATIFLINRDHVLALTFTKSPNNPLSITNNSSNWTEAGIFQPAGLLENNTFNLWYASYGNSTFKVAYTSSQDGISWLPSINLNLESSRAAHNPAILKINTGYLLAYVSSVQGDSDFDLHTVELSNSTTVVPNTKITIPATLSWEDDMNAPFLYEESGLFYLFYTARKPNVAWQLGLATSSDKINWTKCSSPLLGNNIGDVHLLKSLSTYYLYYHSNNGIEVRTSTDPIGCSMTWSAPTTVLPKGPGSYDATQIIAPSLLDVNGTTYLYYSGLGNGVWSLNLATSTPPTPTPTPRPNIVLVPGMFASWNRDALLHNTPVAQSDWILNPIVREYDGIVHTLENLGYQTGTDLFVFTYDWRKPLSQLSDQLDTFIQTVVPSDKPFDIIGHSLGGLVARIYDQDHHPDKLDKMLTLGSPHEGTGYTYPTVSAGELIRTNDLNWLAQKSLLQVLRTQDPFASDKTLLTTNFPILNDLLPTKPFLIKNNVPIPISSMNVFNTTLPLYEPTLSTIDSELISGYSDTSQSLSQFKVKTPTTLDQHLDIYADGHPIDMINEAGDGLITKTSAGIGSNSQNLGSYSHGELIYSKPAIDTLLTTLGLTHTNSDIVAGSSTSLEPALIAYILSPATLSIETQNGIFSEQDGIVYVPNIPKGPIVLKAHGTANGSYKIILGAIGHTYDKWYQLQGEITDPTPSSETDSFLFQYDPESPSIPVIFDNQTNTLSLIQLIRSARETRNKAKIDATITALQKSTTAKAKTINALLLGALHQLFLAYDHSSPAKQALILEALDLFPYFYEQTGNTSHPTLASIKQQEHMTKLILDHMTLLVSSIKPVIRIRPSSLLALRLGSEAYNNALELNGSQQYILLQIAQLWLQRVP